ncbi:3-oxoacyl-[acyl-carrier-protein] reductase [Clostridium vitabionis]|uniref:3-oxoacyl-[acyl-carrier-protein] reductase n=1 Tax=Clostridium vitabionis TaxID=2784388 RepID=UPI00188BC644|nr:3-oxoacyl-[acyl-carrier-protein] reductase [Clostridium vitabionis]
MSERKLFGKTALVTGGSRGIGRACCLALAEAGADLVINYAGNAAEAENTRALCEQMGVRAVTVKAHVESAAECDELFAATKAFSDTLDILVCNAGITRDDLILRMSDEKYREVTGVCLDGTFNCMKRAAKRMLRQRSGRIIAMSSIVGLRGNAGQVNYAAAKAGVIGMAKSLAKELASRGITVNAVAPGFIDTDMTKAMPEAAEEAAIRAIPMGHAGKPEDVAAAVLFFALPDSGYITGQVLAVDGGMAV